MLRHGSRFYLQITPCLPFLHKRSPDGASTECAGDHPERMKGWVGLVGWPIADGLTTSGHPSATGRAQDGERTLTRHWRSTAEPRRPTNASKAWCAVCRTMARRVKLGTCLMTISSLTSELFTDCFTEIVNCYQLMVLALPKCQPYSPLVDYVWISFIKDTLSFFVLSCELQQRQEARFIQTQVKYKQI